MKNKEIDDLKYIKKKYGENMMHLCRKLFPTLLEESGLLSNLLESHFSISKFLYNDIVKNNMEDKFKNYIYSFVNREEKGVTMNQTPQELLNSAGYILYECKTEEEIQKFKKYYAPNERICTFWRNRLETCYVFFAVKKNVEEIRREKFLIPRREDEYGTSVISIQFTRGKINTLSIKNRYNDKVKNPDATFSNNLENIIPGLTKSFEREYNLNINQNHTQNFELLGYVQANDGKIYKYNYKLNDVYYCPNNIIIDNLEVVKKYDQKEKYLIIDYFVIDLQNKTVKCYDSKLKDSFPEDLNNISNINIINKKETGNKIITITPKQGNNIMIEIGKTNKIISYKNDNLTEIEDDFLYYNKSLKNLILSNLKVLADNFLSSNNSLEIFWAPNLIQIGECFLYNNNSLKNLNLNSLIKVGDYFLCNNKSLKLFLAPNLSKVGVSFLYNNECLQMLILSHQIEEAAWFLYNNPQLKKQVLNNIEPKRKIKSRYPV